MKGQENTQEKTQKAVTGEGSALKRYQDSIVGSRSIGSLLYFEWCMFLGVLPGALGLVMRKLFWPRLFGRCGSGTVFGANVTVRHPKRISLGERVVVSDGAILDARSIDETVISIGDDTILSNNVTISCKKGTVRIGNRAGIGTQTVIHSVNGCLVDLGDDLLIGPQCYFAGGGNYNTENIAEPMNTQGLQQAESLVVGSNVWFGAKVTVLPEVTIGSGAIIGAGAVVTQDIGDFATALGVPARVTGYRNQSE